MTINISILGAMDAQNIQEQLRCYLLCEAALTTHPVKSVEPSHTDWCLPYHTDALTFRPSELYIGTKEGN